MRCEECGRPIHNAEMWQLAGGRNAPSPRSMRTLCRRCRQAPGAQSQMAKSYQAVTQAEEILRHYQQGSH